MTRLISRNNSRRRVLQLLAGVVLAVPSFGFAADAAAAKDAAPAKKAKVLYLTQSMGFKHKPVTREGDNLASSEKATIETGEQSGVFEAECTQDAKVITPEKLQQIDVLMFYTTGALPISDENWKAVQDWISSGKGGFIGIHSATDTGWKYGGEGMDYPTFVNGQFAGHPWTQGTPVKIVTHEPSHPTVAMWGESFDYKEEIYQYRGYNPGAVRVLQSLDFTGTPLKKPWFVPVTWVREVGKGRMFYSNLGHTPSTWDDPKFRQNLVEAVKWVTHQTDGPAEPNPDLQAAWTIHSFVAYGQDGKGPAAGQPSADEVFAAVKDADMAWLAATANKVAALRGQPDPQGKDNAPAGAAEMRKQLLAEIATKVKETGTK